MAGLAAQAILPCRYPHLQHPACSTLTTVSRARGAEPVKSEHHGAAALLAATVVNLPFGTLYAFSVFLKPMEALLGATRAEMGFVFGLATVTLTVGMNVAPQLYRRLSPITLALACGLTNGLGLVLAASASGFTPFALGYGVLFGPGTGVLFIIAVNQTVAQRRGLANGYVVSQYLRLQSRSARFLRTNSFLGRLREADATSVAVATKNRAVFQG